MKNVLVTGAAGSIGSLVCKALSHLDGVHVVAIDHAETPLWRLQQELPNVDCRLADVRRDTLPDVVGPNVDAVVHAAALKHVGMCDRNIRAAISTNIFGTMGAIHLARKADARIVLVSTDKAVNPTTVMGATKRVAEVLAANLADSRIVRLVNVYGTQGSLTEVLRLKAMRHEPFVLSHPEATRMFMTGAAAADMIVSAVMDAERYIQPTLLVPTEYETRRIVDVVAELEPGMPIVHGKLAHGEKVSEELLYPHEVGGDGTHLFWPEGTASAITHDRLADLRMQGTDLRWKLFDLVTADE